MRFTLRKLILIDVMLFVILFVITVVSNGRGPQIINDIGWLGYMICVLILLGLLATAAVRRLRGRGSASAEG